MSYLFGSFFTKCVVRLRFIHHQLVVYCLLTTILTVCLFATTILDFVGIFKKMVLFSFTTTSFAVFLGCLYLTFVTHLQHCSAMVLLAVLS
jgi:hypothetical protein